MTKSVSDNPPDSKTANSEVEFHHLAQMFPLIEGSEFDELAADIGKNGLHEPIWRFEGKILDGRNRYRACLVAGIEPTYREFSGSRAEAIAFIIGANIHRRHLTFDVRCKIVQKLLAENPDQSDRQLGKAARVHHTTAGKIRRRAEAKGDVATIATRTDSKGRKQPSSKPSKKATPTPSSHANAIEASQLDTVIKRAEFSAPTIPALEIATAVDDDMPYFLRRGPTALVEALDHLLLLIVQETSWPPLSKREAKARNNLIDDLRTWRDTVSKKMPS